MCDYGCTNGGSTIIPLREIILAVRELSPQMPIVAYLNDLPECRFDITFKTIYNALGIDREFTDVFLIAVGKDFTN